MPRFEDRPDELFARLNASIRFDRRLAPYDVAQSKAHIKALRAAGVLSDDELERLDEGLSAIADEFDVHVTLADERAISQRSSPFRTVGTLADYIVMVMKETDDPTS